MAREGVEENPDNMPYKYTAANNWWKWPDKLPATTQGLSELIKYAEAAGELELDERDRKFLTKNTIKKLREAADKAFKSYIVAWDFSFEGTTLVASPEVESYESPWTSDEDLVLGKMQLFEELRYIWAIDTLGGSQRGYAVEHGVADACDEAGTPIDKSSEPAYESVLGIVASAATGPKLGLIISGPNPVAGVLNEDLSPLLTESHFDLQVACSGEGPSYYAIPVQIGSLSSYNGGMASWASKMSDAGESKWIEAGTPFE